VPRHLESNPYEGTPVSDLVTQDINTHSFRLSVHGRLRHCFASVQSSAVGI
jgi:hypothetical protein